MSQFQSHTKSMKTAISIPDDVFEGAERLARRTRKSRSQLFSDAVKEYVARHASDEATDAMDRVCNELGIARDEFASSAAHRILARSEW
jgi:metal-responsive CopG/Arc/MetJ family transcriptional regulator